MMRAISVPTPLQIPLHAKHSTISRDSTGTGIAGGAAIARAPACRWPGETRCGVLTRSPVARALGVLLALSCLAGVSRAADEFPASGRPAGAPGIEAPASFIDASETPEAGGGPEAEADAGLAEGEAALEGRPGPGLEGARSRRQVEEIVVRARKREELLAETPVAVTALPESELRETGAMRLDDIQDLVPNLQFSGGRDGQEGGIKIRGIGTASGELVYDPGVGIYVDGVFLPRMIGQLVDVLDVEQVEVLRGPQGTLFGKNTVGGAINVTTAKPSPELEAFTFVRAGSFDLVNARAMLNAPIVEDRLFGRVAVSTIQDSGYAENVYRDEGWSNRDSNVVLASLRALVTDGLTNDLSGTWGRSRDHGRGGQCRVVEPTGLGGLMPGFFDACGETEPYRFSANVAGLVDVESYGLWNIAAWEVPALPGLDSLEVRSLTSWREQNIRSRADLDLTFSPALQLSLIGGGPAEGAPWFQRQTSQELQANGEALDGALSFVTGAFGFWEEGTATTTLSAFPGVLNITSETETLIDNWSWALFGQATWDVTDWAGLTAGLRYTQDKKGSTLTVTNVATVPPVPGTPQSGSKIFTAWTPMASLTMPVPESWLAETPLSYAMGYLSWAQGFRGGGFNALISIDDQDELEPFQPETLNSYELGIKSLAFDQQLAVNLALFIGKYDDIQVTTLRVTEDAQGNPTQVEQLTLNAAKATTRGVELEVLAMPMDGWVVQGSTGVLDSIYDQFLGISDLTGQSIDRDGQSFNGVPRFQAHLGVQYSFAFSPPGPAWMRGWWTPRLDWSYQSAIHYAGPEVLGAVQPGYNLLQARLSYDFLDDHAQVALWGQNLTDQTAFNYTQALISSIGILNRYYMPPRTLGVELSYRY